MFNTKIEYLLLCIVVVQCKKLPSYMKPCSITNNYNECAIQHGRETIPEIVKGDKEYDFPVLDPFTIPEMVYKTKDLELTLKNLKVYGLGKTMIDNIDINFEKKLDHVDLSIPLLEVKGDYEIKGQILLLPISGNGPINVQAINLKTEYNGRFDTENRDGKDYRITVSPKVKYTPEKVIFKLDNLFNDKALSDQMNQALNDNWKEVNGELEDVVSESVCKVVVKILDGLTKHIPMEELFLP